jgi:hypothetical protein
MHTPWIGGRRFAFIPAIVNDPQFDPAPPDWADQVRQRLFYDPDPSSGIDRSLRGYIYAISYGKALLEADVFNPVTVQWSHCGATQDDAIRTLPAGHGYEYACVVFTGGSHGCTGWAFYENPPFPGTTSLRNWCYLSMDASLGVWAMELMHAATGFGDLYNTTPHPSNFDNMACSCGTHPSTYTKLTLGWLSPAWIATAPGSAARTFTLHAVALLQPPPPGRVIAVRIPGRLSNRYFLVEARLRVDPYEAITAGISDGIPSEGVVVYEVDEASWPVQLRTPTALMPGQNYVNPAEQLEVEVAAAVPGGFTVAIRSTEHPDCTQIRAEIAQAEGEIRDLQADLRTTAGPMKAEIIRMIRAWQAKLRAAQQRRIELGCGPG